MFKNQISWTCSIISTFNQLQSIIYTIFILLISPNFVFQFIYLTNCSLGLETLKLRLNKMHLNVRLHLSSIEIGDYYIGLHLNLYITRCNLECEFDTKPLRMVNWSLPQTLWFNLPKELTKFSACRIIDCVSHASQSGTWNGTWFLKNTWKFGYFNVCRERPWQLVCCENYCTLHHLIFFHDTSEKTTTNSGVYVTSIRSLLSENQV